VLKNRLAQEFQNLPGQIENARKQGGARLAVLEAYQEQLKETVPTPPRSRLPIT
jgi:hypothetical protein